MLTTLSGSSQSAPTYWLNPANGVSYAVSVQTPQRDINTMTGLQNIPVTSATAADSQLLGGLAKVERTNSNAVVSHYNVQPVIDIFATPQGRDLGALASDIQKAVHDTAKHLPNGASVALRGQLSTMTTPDRSNHWAWPCPAGWSCPPAPPRFWCRRVSVWCRAGRLTLQIRQMS